MLFVVSFQVIYQLEAVVYCKFVTLNIEQNIEC